jgi:sec-independent protein translocase protein TatC
MGFLQHLEELRRRLVWSVLSVVAGFFACWAWSGRIFTWMEKPVIQALHKYKMDEHLVYTNPIDPFNAYLKIGLLAGLFVASPLVLYQVWAFIKPGLYKRERNYVMPFMVSTVGLFVAGGAFGYKIVYPLALDFLIGYGEKMRPMITVTEYMDLFMTIMLGLGLVFEMPVLIFFLALFGIVSAGWMWRNLRYAVLVIFIIAGIITPTPDVMNMCILAAPMLVLYFISIGVAYMVHPKQRRKRAEKA